MAWLGAIHFFHELLFGSLKWCSWEKFACRRGVRQGDPFSPILLLREQIFFSQWLTN
jgi:hypothetical protein